MFCLSHFIFLVGFKGRFTIAAKHHFSIAEIYETELVDIEKVLNFGMIFFSF